MPETNQPPAYWMEEEIDLREYVEVIIRRWWWIVGCAVVAAVAAFGVTSIMPPTYEASSVVIVTEPRYQMEFDPRFQTSEGWQPAYKVFPELATSDGVLKQVVEGYQPSQGVEIGAWKLGTLRSMVEATSQGDPSLVKLQVTSPSPEDAAGIANVWAQKLADRGNAIYSDNEQDVTFFEEQVAQADGTLDNAQEALIAFRAEDRRSVLEAQLTSHRQTQSDYLSDLRTIDYLVQDNNALRDQLARAPAGGGASVGDELTALLLQMKAFDGAGTTPVRQTEEASSRGGIGEQDSTSMVVELQTFSSDSSTPIQIQIAGTDSLSNRSRADQIRFLETMVETLEAKSTDVEDRLAGLEPQILELQEDLETMRAREARLTRTRDLAEETLTTLSRKLDEARIAAQEQGGLLQVGSYAAVPESPSGPQRKLSTAVAGAVGLMVGLFSTFVWEWWNDEEEE